MIEYYLQILAGVILWDVIKWIYRKVKNGKGNGNG